jgi:hypothetical protein
MYFGVSLFVRYSFLIISNKFCDLSLLPTHCSGRYKDVGGVGGQCGKKHLLHSALEAHVHKTTYGHKNYIFFAWDPPLVAERRSSSPSLFPPACRDDHVMRRRCAADL